MSLDPDNPVVALCLEGTRAEFDGRHGDAQAAYERAWAAATDDWEACIAAHYVARFPPDPSHGLRWNVEAMARASRVTDGRAQALLPSLWLALGGSYEQLGDQEAADDCFNQAAALGVVRPHP